MQEVTEQKLFETHKKMIKIDTDTDQINKLMVDLMKQVEKLNMSGDQKKQIVLRVLRMIVDSIEMNDESRQTYNGVLNHYAPHMIDFVIYLSKNKINLKKLSNNCTCWRFFLIILFI